MNVAIHCIAVQGFDIKELNIRKSLIYNARRFRGARAFERFWRVFVQRDPRIRRLVLVRCNR